MTLVEVCAYAGTGNVLKVQKLLHICSEHYEPAEKVSLVVQSLYLQTAISIQSCTASL
jgi:hypothetical protein